MKAVNTHNLKMVGLKAASSETKGLCGAYSGQYVQIGYDTKTGEVITNYHVSLGANSWTKYHNGDVINCGNVFEPMTMQAIANKIAEAVNSRR